MVLLNDVKVSQSSRPSPDEIIQNLKLVFNGEIKPDVGKKSQAIEGFENKPKTSIPVIDMIVFFSFILIITIGSLKLQLQEKVTNPYIMSVVHAILIIILFYLYLKIKG